MKRILYITLVVLTVIPAACKKHVEPEPELGREEFPGNVIYYTTVDGLPLLLPDINAFSANYVATYYDNGQGILLFADNIETINSGVFNNFDNLKTIGFSPYIKTIGDDAFSGCSNLEKVSFPGGLSVTSFGKNAFKDCKKLTEFSFAKKVDTIGDNCFDGCESLSGIGLGEYTGTLGNYAFKGCKNLKTFSFGQQVDVIGDNCFEDCVSLCDVTLPQQAKSFGSYVFKGCTALHILVPNFEGDLPATGTNTFDNDDVLLIRVSYDRFNDYKSAWGANADKHVIVFDGRDKIDLAHWTDYIPECMPLTMLTIPGAHDSATYFALKDGPYADIIKDQDITYKDQWNWGVRFFDLRIGYDSDNDYYFYHGHYGWWSKLDDLSTITKLPDQETIKNSFMFLEFQVDNPEKFDAGIAKSLMEKVMSYLTSMYDKSRFVAFHPKMTFGEARGKILVSVTDAALEDGISLPFIFRDGNTITPFHSTIATDPFDIVVQNEFDAGGKKYDYIIDGLQRHKNAGLSVPFFNNLNATAGVFSWPVSKVINPKVTSAIENQEAIFMQPLGIVLYDYVGVDSLTVVFMRSVTTYEFGGGKLTKALVRHNFADVLFK